MMKQTVNIGDKPKNINLISLSFKKVFEDGQTLTNNSKNVIIFYC